MGKMLLLDRNRLDQATLSANVSELIPLANLKDLSTSVRTRLNGTSTVEIEITLSADNPWNISVIAIAGTNLTPAAQAIVYHKATSGGAWITGESFDFGAPTVGFGSGGFGSSGFGGFATPEEEKNPKGFIHFAQFSAVNKQYWKIQFTDDGNADSFIEIGRIWLCEPFVPELDWTTLGYQPLEDSQVEISDAQALYSDLKDVRRQIQFGINRVKEGEAFGEWAWLFQQLGGAKPFPIIFTPQATSGAKKWLAVNGFFSQLPTMDWAGPSEGTEMFSLGGATFQEVF